MTNNIIIIILVILNFFAFILGLLCGKILLNNSQTNTGSQSFFKQQKQSNAEKNSISIDESKYVIDIKTTDLEKKYDSLGETKQSTEQISSSINKLKNLKK